MPRTLLALGCLLVATPIAGAADDPRLKGFRHPPGWGVSIAAEEPLIVNPVTMTFGDDGRLFVVEWKAGRGPNDRIKVLTDTDGDGTFDRSEVYMDGLDLPAGVAFRDGWTYVTLDHDVVRLKDENHDGHFETRQVIATGFGNDDSHHRVSGLAFGPDGYLYMTTGDSDAHARGSDGSKADVLRCGGVFRCRPDGSKLENVAFGMRNPWGNVAFDDAFQIFHTDNDNEGSPGFTGCRLLHVVDGGDYGWRLREGARCCAPDFERATWNGGRPGRLGWMAETGRGAPAGLCMLNSAAFPKRLANLAIYPDVFRKSVRAYPLKPSGSTYLAPDEIELLASDEGLFRPTDAEVGPDGALYILDWRTDSGGAGQLSGNGKNGRIYRMTWTGTKEEPALPTAPRDRFAHVASDSVESLLSKLSDPDPVVRRVVNAELGRRSPASVPADALVKLLSNPVAKLPALALLFNLHAGDLAFRPALVHSVVDSDPALRRFAFTLLARTPGKDDDTDRILAGLARRGLISSDEPPAVRRAAAASLGRFASFQAKSLRDPSTSQGPAKLLDPRLLATLSAETLADDLLNAYAASPESDPFLRDALRLGSEHLGPQSLNLLVRTLGEKDRPRAAAALSLLQSWKGDDGLNAILNAATAPEDVVPPPARVGLFRALRELVPAVPADPIANWLKDHPKSDPAPRVEALRVLAALHERSNLAVGPVLPSLLVDDQPTVRRAALALARDVRNEPIRDTLLDLARRDDRPVDERALALAALRGYDGLDLEPLALGLFPKVDDPGLKLEILRTLAPRNFDAASKLAESLLPSKNRELRHEAIMLLGSKPVTARLVADRYLAGNLPPEDLARVIDAVRPHASPDLQATLQRLLAKTLNNAPQGARLQDLVARLGNADRGKSIYLDAKKGSCATCHRLEGVGGSVGPDLTRVWDTLSFDKRAESIFEPSREIKEGFGTFKVATVDGRILTGLLLADTKEGVTLKDAEGKEVRVPAREIEEKKAEPTSLMPAGVVGHLSLNELADLLAFLGDRKAQEALRAPK